MNTDTKHQIETALRTFSGADLRAAAIGLLNTLGYRLALSSGPPEAFESISNEGQVMAYVREHGEITNQQCRKLLGLDADQTYYLIKKLCDNKRLKPKGKGRWRKYILY